MKTHYLKLRMQSNVYERLKSRAAESGKPISTFANILLEEENSITNIAIQICEIKSQLQELAVLIASPPRATNDAQVKPNLDEVLLIVRELAMERNAQILSRVAAQIKSKLGVKND